MIYIGKKMPKGYIMKKSAINSFLAATAMAWLSPATAGETFQTVNATENASNSEHSDAFTSINAEQHQDPRVIRWRFSHAERQALLDYLYHHPNLTGAEVSNAFVAPTSIEIGQKLSFEHLRNARVVPSAFSPASAESRASVVDVIIQGRVVRVLKQSREVIDMA